MNQPGCLNSLLDLVALHRADHVPAHRGRCSTKFGVARAPLIDLRGSLQELLHAVLCKVHLAQLHEFANLFHRTTLGNHHQHDVFWSTASDLGSRGDTGLHIHVALLEGGAVRVLRSGSHARRIRARGGRLAGWVGATLSRTNTSTDAGVSGPKPIPSAPPPK